MPFATSSCRWSNLRTADTSNKDGTSDFTVDTGSITSRRNWSKNLRDDMDAPYDTAADAVVTYLDILAAKIGSNVPNKGEIYCLISLGSTYTTRIA